MTKTKCVGIAIITGLSIFEETISFAAATKYTPVINATIRVSRTRNTRVNKRAPTCSTILFQTKYPSTWGSEIAVIISLAMAIAVGIKHASCAWIAFSGTGIIVMTVQRRC
jgi:hypothetical protein